jgi:hypothetical protein
MKALRSLALAGLLLFGCAGSAPEPMGKVPASFRSFAKPYAKVWKVVTETVQYDFLIPIELAEPKRGYFSSELIKDFQPQRTKYRLSGTVMFDGSATIVKLYRQLEVEDNGAWITVPSDLSLEARILDAVGRKLGTK